MPTSFATQAYYGVSALWFVDSWGKKRAFRWQILPVVKPQFLEASALRQQGPSYLFNDLKRRLHETKRVEYMLCAQLAGVMDEVNDSTHIWSGDRPVIQLGTITLERELCGMKDLNERGDIVFNPVPDCEGIEVSDDPLWNFRATMYRMAGDERMAALMSKTTKAATPRTEDQAKAPETIMTPGNSEDYTGAHNNIVLPREKEEKVCDQHQ